MRTDLLLQDLGIDLHTLLIGGATAAGLAAIVAGAHLLDLIRKRRQQAAIARSTAIMTCPACPFKVASLNPGSLTHMREIIRAHHQATGGAHGTPIEHIPEGWDR